MDEVNQNGLRQTDAIINLTTVEQSDILISSQYVTELRYISLESARM